jgi:hypothetical protein
VFSTYAGTGINLIKIPVLADPKEKPSAGGGGGEDDDKPTGGGDGGPVDDGAKPDPAGGDTKKKSENKDEDEIERRYRPLLQPGMRLFGNRGYFDRIEHAGEPGYAAIARVRLADALGERVGDVEGNIVKIRAMIENNGGYKLSHVSKNPEERRLAKSAGSYSSPNGDCYRPDFAKGYNKLPLQGGIDPEGNIVKIWAMVKELGGYKLSWGSKNPEERRLANSAGNYSTPNGDCYRPDFAKGYNKLPLQGGIDPEGNIVKIWAMVKELGGYKLSQVSKNPEERRLAKSAGNYSTPNGDCYRPDFAKGYNKLPIQARKPRK